jgi:hypothetical protein
MGEHRQLAFSCRVSGLMIKGNKTMKIYLFKYTNTNRGLCYDAQEANNAIAAMNRHKEMFPNGNGRQYKRPSDGQWVNFE